jgi:hypothetical protein
MDALPTITVGGEESDIAESSVAILSETRGMKRERRQRLVCVCVNTLTLRAVCTAYCVNCLHVSVTIHSACHVPMDTEHKMCFRLSYDSTAH